jgi:site-specific recombinase XerD
MDQIPVPIHASIDLDSSLSRLIKDAQNHIKDAKAENTKRAYRSDWKSFENWCTVYGFDSLPALPTTVILYITDMANDGYKYSTIRRHVSSISMFHKMNQYPSPTRDIHVIAALEGIGKKIGKNSTPKRAAELDYIAMMVDAIDTSRLIGVRDKALILLGFATASRRSELVEIRIEDIERKARGIVVTIHARKTNEVLRKGVVATHNDYCPIKAVDEWIERAGITSGPLFRAVDRYENVGERALTPQVVAKVVKKVAKAAGLNPKEFAGHSLRSGIVTTSGQKGFNIQAGIKQTGHKTPGMVMRYQQEGQIFDNNISSMLGDL